MDSKVAGACKNYDTRVAEAVSSTTAPDPRLIALTTQVDFLMAQRQAADDADEEDTASPSPLLDSPPASPKPPHANAPQSIASCDPPAAITPQRPPSNIYTGIGNSNKSARRNL